ncbi:hypothetical protein ACFPA8_11430 [Streptomyces ovatisporus]|uniref:Uncharacterized protein n=1 Tax=Streptomyces ovatisporus TaxID=1128682 RepID=A0ABV9A871_9ACTN
MTPLLGGGDLFRMPRRVGYRQNRGGERVLDFGRGMHDHWVLTAHTAGWDPRVLAALTALHCSHDGILGSSWDAGGAGEGEPTGAAASAAGA